jgi:hypothetical protein
MTEDFAVRFLDTRDDASYMDTGKVHRTRKYTFKLGDHGPFVERVPLEGFDEQEIVRRIQALRNHLRLISQA